MKAIIALAETLSKMALCSITRLDIQLVYTGEDEAYYCGRLWLADNINDYFDIYESGEIKKGSC